MIVIEKLASKTTMPAGRLVLPYELRCKSRLRTRLESGEEAGIFMERGTILRGGNYLEANDGRIVEVVAAQEEVMEIRSADPLLLSRAAYHLGNRHVAVELGAGLLRFSKDHVLAEMIKRLGLSIDEISSPFEPEGGAYGHGHSPDGEGKGARIHDMKGRP